MSVGIGFEGVGTRKCYDTTCYPVQNTGMVLTGFTALATFLTLSSLFDSENKNERLLLGDAAVASVVGFYFSSTYLYNNWSLPGTACTKCPSTYFLL